jgi:hypothetical protein
MGYAGPLLLPRRSPYDGAVRSLAAQQPGADGTWNDWKRQLSMVVRRGRDVGWFDKLDAFYWYAMPELAGSAIRVNLRNPSQVRTVSVGSYDHEGYAGLRFADGGRIDTGLAFTGANAHTLLSYYNSNDDDDFGTATSGARSSGAQIQFNPRTNLDRMTLRSGPVITLSNPSVSSLGLCGLSRVDAAHVRVCLAGNAVDQEFPTDGALPAGTCFFGQINGSTEGSQTHLRVADILCRARALGADEMADIHQSISDFLEYFDELAAYVDPAALGDSWFRRDHLGQVTPAGSAVMVGPTGPPVSDNQTNVASYYGSGYSRFPCSHNQVRVVPETAAAWQQTGNGVLIRMWENRISLPNRKPNGVDLPKIDGKPVRIHNKPPAVDYDTLDWAELCSFGTMMALAGKTPEHVIGVLQGLGLPLTDHYDTPGSNVFTAQYAADHAADIFTAVRVGKAVASNKLFLPEGRMSDVPNGKCTIIRPDSEMRDFRSPARLQKHFTEHYNAFCAEEGILFAPGFNALQAAASSGVSPSVMPALVALSNLWSINITATRRPPGGDMAGWLDRELAFYGANPPKKLLLSWAIGPFALQREAGVALCGAVNDWMAGHADVMRGYSETPSNVAFGGDYTTWPNLCRARMYGIKVPTDPDYPGDPTPPITHTRDYFFAFGSMPPGITVTRADPRYAYDQDGTFTQYATNVGRFEYADGSCRGLVIEAGTTQAFARTSELDNSIWTKSRCTILADQAASPDGATSLDKMTEDNTTGTHAIALSGTPSWVSGVSYEVSCTAKAGTRTLLQINLPSNGFGVAQRLNFDLVNGTASSVAGSAIGTIRHVGNGLWRCSVMMTATATASAGNANFSMLSDGTSASYLGDGSSYLYIGELSKVSVSGVQVHTPNSGATALTIAGDDANCGSTELLTDRAAYIRAEAAFGHGAKQYLLSVFNGTTLWEVYRHTDMHIHVRTKVSGTVTSDIDLGAVADGSAFAIAARYAVTDFAAVINNAGSVGAVQTSGGSNGGGAPSGLTTAYVGRDSAGTNYLNSEVLTFQHRSSATNADLLAAVTDWTGFEVET